MGGLFQHRIDNAEKAIKEFGFKTREFKTTRTFLDGRAGTIQNRLDDIHDCFSDTEVKAIVCNIGGLSSNELVNRIDYGIIRKNPKIFCGYSDITILHHAFNKMAGLVTFYGPAAMTQFGEFPRPIDYTMKYFLRCLSQEVGRIEPSREWTDENLDWSRKEDTKRPRKMNTNNGFVWVNPGSVKGQIVGGCLPSIIKLNGTKFELNYKNKILFLDIPEGQDFTKGEPLEYVDSEITDLINHGVFDVIKGLVVGRGYGYSREERIKLRKIITKHVKNIDIPVLTEVDIGHTDPMITVPLCVEASLDSEHNLFSIDESGVI